MKRTTAVVLGLLAICWLAAPARAGWGSSASGSATALATNIAAPTNLVAQCGLLLDATVKLTWQGSTPWASGYEVRRWGTGGEHKVTVTGLTYTTPTLPLGTYNFEVRAKKGNWLSGPSNTQTKSIVSILFLGVLCQ